MKVEMMLNPADRDASALLSLAASQNGPFSLHSDIMESHIVQVISFSVSSELLAH